MSSKIPTMKNFLEKNGKLNIFQKDKLRHYIDMRKAWRDSVDACNGYEKRTGYVPEHAIEELDKFFRIVMELEDQLTLLGVQLISY